MDDLDGRLTTLATELRAEDPIPRAQLDQRARRIRVRRRATRAGIATLVVVIVTATVVAVRGGDQAPQVRVVSPTTVPSLPSSRFPAVPLPPKYRFNQISVTTRGLVLSGEVADSAASVTPKCASASVNPETLELGPVREARCDDPSLDGGTVGVVNTYAGVAETQTVRIARADPQTGRVSVGPVVMTYGEFSDTKLATAEGGGWLWVYDVSTTNGPELLQVSESSGEVVKTFAMPEVYRPKMAANDDGVWFGPAVNGGGPSRGLIFVRSHAVAPTDVFTVSVRDSVCWIRASGHDVWAGTGPDCLRQTIRHFHGTDLQPRFAAPDRGYEPNAVVGDATHGLWTMQWKPPLGTSIPKTPQPQDIVRIDPNTGAERVVATLPPTEFPPSLEMSGGLLDGEAVVLDGSLYLLEPPLRQGGYNGFSSLVRVALPG